MYKNSDLVTLKKNRVKRIRNKNKITLSWECGHKFHRPFPEIPLVYLSSRGHSEKHTKHVYMAIRRTAQIFHLHHLLCITWGRRGMNEVV